jgi:hypothetical protein
MTRTYKITADRFGGDFFVLKEYWRKIFIAIFIDFFYYM